MTTGWIDPIDTSKPRPNPNPMAYPQSKKNYEPIGNSELGIYTSEPPKYFTPNESVPKIEYKLGSGSTTAIHRDTISPYITNSYLGKEQMQDAYHDKDLDEHLNAAYGAGNYRQRRTKKTSKSKRHSSEFDIFDINF